MGALAARRAQEKANERRRRMSIDKAPHTLDQSSLNALKEGSMYVKRGSASPDLGGVRKNMIVFPYLVCISIVLRGFRFHL